MEKWIKFKEGQIKRKDGSYEYESNTKFRLTSEDNTFYYIGKNKFDKSIDNYETDYIEKENIKRD